MEVSFLMNLHFPFRSDKNVLEIEIVAAYVMTILNVTEIFTLIIFLCESYLNWKNRPYET